MKPSAASPCWHETNDIELSPDEKTLYVGESTIGSTPARLSLLAYLAVQ